MAMTEELLNKEFADNSFKRVLVATCWMLLNFFIYFALSGLLVEYAENGDD